MKNVAKYYSLLIILPLLLTPICALSGDQKASISAKEKYRAKSKYAEYVPQANIERKHRNLALQKLFRQKKYAQVISVLEVEVSQSSNWQDQFLLGSAYLMTGQLDGAASALDAALAYKSDKAELWVQRATVEQERGNAESALQLINIALQMDSECVEAYMGAAYAYEQLGQIDSARMAYSQYLRLAASDHGKSPLRGKVLARLSTMSIVAEQ